MKKQKTYGGVLGRNIAHQKRITTMARVILGMIAIILTVAFVGADHESVGVGLQMAGAASLAALPVFMLEGKFKELTGADWETFKKDATPEELAEYFNQKNEAKRFELKSLIDAKASKDDIDNAIKQLKDDQVDQLKALNDTLKAYGMQIKKLTDREKEARGVATNSIRKGLEDNLQKLKGLKGDIELAKNNEFSFKTVGDMTIAGNVTGGNVPVEQRLAGLNVIASRRVRLLDIVSRGTASSNIISWVYQANKDGVTGYTAEGDPKNQIDFDLVVASEKVQKITAFIKVSDEMIDDVDFMESEIRNELFREVVKKVETEVYSGAGGANAINGIRTVASAFAAGSFAGTVENANLVDVLRVAMNQVELASQEGANYILLNPTDVTKLLLIKTTSTDRRYIDALQMIAGNLTLDGVPIVKTILVTAGQYLVGNFTLATVYDKGEVMIQVGMDGNDFTMNMRTVRAEWRGLCIVKNNDRSAFVKGVIATDAAALETT